MHATLLCRRTITVACATTGFGRRNTTTIGTQRVGAGFRLGGTVFIILAASRALSGHTNMTQTLNKLARIVRCRTIIILDTTTGKWLAQTLVEAAYVTIARALWNRTIIVDQTATFLGLYITISIHALRLQTRVSNIAL